MGAGGQENATQFRCWSSGIRSDMELSWDPSRVAARTLLVTTRSETEILSNKVH